MVNIVLLGASLIGMLFMFYSTIPKVEQKKETISYVHIIKNPAFIFYILIFGFYFIAEHGILNWFMLYGINGLELEYDRASFFLSIFFGGITLGRLMFAPLVQMLGVQRSVIVFGLIGGLLLYNRHSWWHKNSGVIKWFRSNPFYSISYFSFDDSELL